MSQRTTILSRPMISSTESLPVGITSIWQGLRAFRYKPLIYLLVLGCLPRFYWMIVKTPVISLEGSEYVRMAQNLANGKGLIGNFPGPETMYTPLLSILTAGLSLLTRNAELAAHLVCVVFGTSLIIPVFLIALRMYGVRVAYLSAMLIAFHPLLIALSGSIYNENVYLPLLLAGVLVGMRALEFGKTRDFVLVGLFLGLAYLTRPEAFAYPAFFAVAIWAGVLFARIPVRRALLGSALILGTFLIIASPYIHFLYAHTGHLRLEGKWNINYTIANRIRSGMGYAEAAYGLGPDSTVSGPLLDPFRFASYTPYPQSAASKVGTLLAMAKRNLKDVFGNLRDSSIGGPFVLALILLGLFRKSWSPRRLFHESIVICMVISILLLMITASLADFRYVLPFIPFACLWMAKGIDEMAGWTKSVVCSLKWRYLPSGKGSGELVRVGLVLLIFAVAFLGTRNNVHFLNEQTGYADIKQASLWLKSVAPGPKKIACMATVPTYYAEGTIVGLPYAESSEALRYFDESGVDYIFLDSHYATALPEAAGWMSNGIPDSRAHLIYKTGTGPTNSVEIYRWDNSSLTQP